MEQNTLLDNSMRLNELDGWKGCIVRHFKGDFYLVLDTNVIHTETKERMVLYKALYSDCDVYVRPAHMFIEKCTKEQFEEYGQIYRFEFVKLPSQKRSQN